MVIGAEQILSELAIIPTIKGGGSFHKTVNKTGSFELNNDHSLRCEEQIDYVLGRTQETRCI